MTNTARNFGLLPSLSAASMRNVLSMMRRFIEKSASRDPFFETPFFC